MIYLIIAVILVIISEYTGNLGFMIAAVVFAVSAAIRFSNRN